MKRKAVTALILLLILMFTSWPTWSSDVEREALIALYNSTNGGSWTNNTGWNTPTDHCTWHGVYCDSGNVTELILYENNLSGNIPSELGNLSKLIQLDLLGNQLSGPIPPQLGNLPVLGWLILSDNQLNGHIPPELGSLSNLQILALGSNQLTGSIPPELGNLSNLLLLNLYDNNLNGSIPAELSNLPKLLDLFLNANPNLVCWETQAALTWALGLTYDGPGVVCQFVHLPLVTR